MSFCTSPRTQFPQPSWKRALPSIQPLLSYFQSRARARPVLEEEQIAPNIPHGRVTMLVYSRPNRDQSRGALRTGLGARGQPPSMSPEARGHLIMDT